MDQYLDTSVICERCKGSIHALIWVAVLLVLVQMTFALLLSQARGVQLF